MRTDAVADTKGVDANAFQVFVPGFTGVDVQAVGRVKNMVVERQAHG
jgi:hypothetical protein